MYAFVFAQFTDCGSETLPCRPSRSYTLRATVADRAPLHRAEDRVRRRELQVAELLQQVVHVQRARARSGSRGREMNRIRSSGLRARQERADRLVEPACRCCGVLGADRGAGVRREVGMVGGDVVRQAVLRAVDRSPRPWRTGPTRCCPSATRWPAMRLPVTVERLVQVGVGPVAVRGPAHAVDRPLQAGLLQRVLAGRPGSVNAAALRQDAAGDQRAR